MNRSNWMIYGANGYTGQLIARQAVDEGLRPVLAGRNRRAIKSLADRLGCDCRVFRLRGAERIAQELLGTAAVLNCAGPFSATAGPIIEGCLRTGTDYLDITGEIDVIEAAAARHHEAKRMGICLIPAVGFDVVPSDCLAAMLAGRLPDATGLQLAFALPARVSPGTARTVLQGLPKGGRARIDGRITKVPLAWKTMQVPFRNGTQTAVTVPWGDVASAWHTTGIANIEVYAAVPGVEIEKLRRLRSLAPWLGIWPIRTLLGHAVARSVKGPTPRQRERGRASFWGRVADRQGNSAAATLETPEGYRLTAMTAAAAVQRVLGGNIRTGFSTPSRAFGAEFILDMPGTDLQWQRRA